MDRDGPLGDCLERPTTLTATLGDPQWAQPAQRTRAQSDYPQMATLLPDLLIEAADTVDYLIYARDDEV